MCFAASLSRFAAALFGGAAAEPDGAIEPALLDDAIDAIVDAVEPRLKLLPRYRKRVAPAATRTIRFLRTLAPAFSEPVALLPAGWSSNEFLKGLFVSADALTSVLMRSSALRKFFADRANVRYETAYGVLAMRREERNVLASALIDGELRSGVARTTLGFADHRIVALAGEAAAMRRRTGELILERLATLALERVVATRERATALETRVSLLATQLRMLKLKAAGRELTPDEPDPAAAIAKIERELSDKAKERNDAKANLATLDYSIEQIDAVLGDPERHAGLDVMRLRVSHSGYKLDAQSTEPGTDLVLNELWIGSALRVVVVPVAIPRTAVAVRVSN
jgi:hypothetical protein